MISVVLWAGSTQAASSLHTQGPAEMLGITGKQAGRAGELEVEVSAWWGMWSVCAGVLDIAALSSRLGLGWGHRGYNYNLTWAVEHTVTLEFSTQFRESVHNMLNSSVVTNIRIRIWIQIFSPESKIFGIGFVIFARRIIFGFGFVIESLPSNLNLFNFWRFYQNF